ncbi:hypothetical protein GCM10010448_16710 [Streptomyces glomeratus]|uniref:Transcriptional regulator n=1 Tax=Streptomyces glomeratus TaxID=284452 RepID=A0ABP6L7Q8_9ACTN
MRPLCVTVRDLAQQKAEVHANVSLRSKECAGCGIRTRKPSQAEVFETSVYTVPPTRLGTSESVPGHHRPAPLGRLHKQHYLPQPVRGARVTAPESPQPVADDDKSHVPPLTTRVVIAEDEALIRLDLKEMLEEEGYTVVGEAGDGEQAVELAREHKPDLVILDVKMPKLDGISAAEKIAEERIAPVLMLTAFSQRDLVERARDAGAMAYLVKPFSKSDVVPAIEMAVSRFNELKTLEKEVADLTLRLETRKLVDRAKSILQTEYGLTEPAAFRWIQKTSMDRRMSMQQVAEAVIQDAEEKKASKG